MNQVERENHVLYMEEEHGIRYVGTLTQADDRHLLTVTAQWGGKVGQVTLDDLSPDLLPHLHRSRLKADALADLSRQLGTDVPPVAQSMVETLANALRPTTRQAVVDDLSEIARDAAEQGHPDLDIEWLRLHLMDGDGRLAPGADVPLTPRSTETGDTTGARVRPTPAAQRLQAVKAAWLRDPSWDLESTPGLEAHREELEQFRRRAEPLWHAENQEALYHLADRLGVPGNLLLADAVRQLEERIARLEGSGTALGNA